MKIKIIDLLIKAINKKELPLKIMYNDFEYQYDKEKKDYLMVNATGKTYFWGDEVSCDITWGLDFFLDEVEIINEERNGD